MPLNVAVFYGSVRTERQGIRVARFVVREFQKRGHIVSFVDPAIYRLPLLDKMYKEYDPKAAPQTLQELAQIVKHADGYVIVSGEYNHSIPPALSNTLDHFLEEYFYKPSGIVCYSPGSAGGVRAAMQLRAMLGELGMSSIPTIYSVPRLDRAFDEAGTPADQKHADRFAGFVDEFVWYAEALKAARERGVPA